MLSTARRAAIIVAACLAFAPKLALALPTGIATPNCDGCHAASGFDGELSFTPPGTITAGQTIDLTLTVRESQMSVTGFYLTTLGVGTLAGGENSRLINGELVHSKPNPASDGVTEIPFSWTAPSGQGGVDFLVTVVAADGNGEPGNDRVAWGGFSAVWGCDGVPLYRDIDGDGYGNDGDVILRCAAEDGWATVGGDCVDFRDTVHPGATEVANGRDDDCNGEVDEGITRALLYPDRDGDGYGSSSAVPVEGDIGTPGTSPNGEDCDDANPDTHPDAEEICDGRDQNCNDEIDEGSYEYCGVGRCLVRLELCDHACVPLQPFPEQCNGLDDDCDGEVDEGDLCPEGQVCELHCVDAPAAAPAAAIDAGSSEAVNGADVDLGTNTDTKVPAVPAPPPSIATDAPVPTATALLPDGTGMPDAQPRTSPARQGGCVLGPGLVDPRAALLGSCFAALALALRRRASRRR